MVKLRKDRKLSSSEVAELLGVTVPTIRNYRVRGLLRAEEERHGLRTVYRFDPEEVIRFAKEKLGFAAGSLELGEPHDETNH